MRRENSCRGEQESDEPAKRVFFLKKVGISTSTSGELAFEFS